MANSNKRYLVDWKEDSFPYLDKNLYEVKSDETPLANCLAVPPYNCFAFAAGDDTRWWEPDLAGQYYWPSGIARDYTVAACIEMFESLGYEKCWQSTPEPEFEKVAVYHTRLGNPWTPSGSLTHAALQQNGIWKSKLGYW